jgi:hypothetical protein
MFHPYPGDDARRQFAAGDSPQKLAGDVDVGHESLLAHKKPFTLCHYTAARLRKTKKGGCRKRYAAPPAPKGVSR